MPYCRIPIFFAGCCALTRSWRAKRERQGARAAVFCTVPTTHANRGGVRRNGTPTLIGGSASVATIVVVGRPRCRYVFWAGASIWRGSTGCRDLLRRGGAAGARGVVVAPGLAGPNPGAARLSAALAIPLRTLERWRQWWKDHFPVSTLWQASGASFMPPVTERFPTSLLERFVGDAAEAMGHLLFFLTPITVRPSALPGGR